MPSNVLKDTVIADLRTEIQNLATDGKLAFAEGLFVHNRKTNADVLYPWDYFTVMDILIIYKSLVNRDGVHIDTITYIPEGAGTAQTVLGLRVDPEYNQLFRFKDNGTPMETKRETFGSPRSRTVESR